MLVEANHDTHETLTGAGSVKICGSERLNVFQFNFPENRTVAVEFYWHHQLLPVLCSTIALFI